MKLSFGLAANVFDNRIDFSKVVVVEEIDPFVFNNVQNKAVIDGKWRF